MYERVTEKILRYPHDDEHIKPMVVLMAQRYLDEAVEEAPKFEKVIQN